MAQQEYNKIVWLASYPKSGNTWFRAFLANLLHEDSKTFDINELEGGPIASSRQLFDEATGLASSDLTHEEIENLRPHVFEYIARNTEDVAFHKIHDAFILTSEGIPLIPYKATRGVLYFVRNPLDVAVSFAHHANLDFSTIAQAMNNNDYAFGNKTSRLHMQLKQKLLTWSNHITSWVDASSLPVMIIKYEDMMLNSFETFSKAVKFIGMTCEDNKIKEAIDRSNFKELQKQEQEKGFREKSPDSVNFFRKGKIGSWKEELPDSIVIKIVHDHKSMMERLGYLQELETKFVEVNAF